MNNFLQTVGKLSLGDWANLATLAATFLAFVTVCLAIREYFRRKSEREEDGRPYVIVQLEPSEASQQLFNVVIKNIGKSSAKNINIKFSPNQKMQTGSGEKGINSLMMLQNIHFLPPDKSLSFYFGSYLDQEGDASIRKLYTITVKYASVSGKAYVEELKCDPREYEGATSIDTKTVHDGVKSLEKIVDSLNKHNSYSEDIAKTIKKHGIRIRNMATDKTPIEQVGALVKLIEGHSENEMWLNPFVYDFFLLVKQARDSMLTIHKQTTKEKKLVKTLNELVGIDESKWHFSEEKITELFDRLKKEYKEK